MLPLLCATCPQCDSRTEEARAADEAYNHMITLGMRISCVACAMVVVAAVTSTGHRPDVADYRLMLIVLATTAGIIWGALRFLIGETRRALWQTALIPSFMIVACFFVIREVNGVQKAALADTLPVIEPTAASATRLDTKAPLSQVAGDCFDFLHEQAAHAAAEVKSANLRGMFDVKPDAMDKLKEDRERLTKLDRQLIESDARIRKTASELTARLRDVRPSSRSAATLVAAVRDSAAEVARKARESLAQQRRLIESAQTMLNFLEPRAGLFSMANQRIVVNNVTDTEAFERLLADFDAIERRGATALREVQKQHAHAMRRVSTDANATRDAD